MFYLDRASGWVFGFICLAVVAIAGSVLSVAARSGSMKMGGGRNLAMDIRLVSENIEEWSGRRDALSARLDRELRAGKNRAHEIAELAELRHSVDAGHRRQNELQRNISILSKEIAALQRENRALRNRKPGAFGF